MTTKKPTKTKTVTVNAWALIDNRKGKITCAGAKGTERYDLGFATILFKKPNLKNWNLGQYRDYKEVVPCTITYQVKSK